NLLAVHDRRATKTSPLGKNRTDGNLLCANRDTPVIEMENQILSRERGGPEDQQRESNQPRRVHRHSHATIPFSFDVSATAICLSRSTSRSRNLGLRLSILPSWSTWSR